MNKKSEIINKILKEYAIENQVPVRSTSDLSLLEAWLLTKLLEAYKDTETIINKIKLLRQDNDKD